MRARWLMLLLALFSGLAAAGERILDFHSEIEIRQDGSLIVEEYIRVRAEGGNIRRGIYRDFPTRYRTPAGLTRRVGFELLETRRDGQPEQSRVESRGNGLRIYLGRADYLLPPGEHEYRIRYRTTRQLGFFDDHDELYWNVTGNGWMFPIDQASARVTLPAPVSVSELRLDGFTGPQGSSERFYTSYIEDERRVVFETTRGLGPREGLTLVLGWPKELVTPPSEEELFLDDNRHNLVAGGSLLAVLVYYLFAWLRVGRDPESGVIAPLYRPPENLSPASMRYLEKMGYDRQAFTAALVNLAVKGVISIDKPGKRFVIQRLQENPSHLAPGEQTLLGALFEAGDRLELDPANHHILQKARNRHRKRLAADFNKVMFRTNRKYLVPGILLSVAGAAWGLSLIPDPDMLSATVTITVMAAMLLVLGASLWKKWRAGLSLFKLLPLLVMIGVLGFVLKTVLDMLLTQQGPPAWPLVLSLAGLAAVNLGFFEWIKAPTPGGRRLLDRIAGFKLYLSVAEGDDLLLRGEPRFSAERFQEYLPYAIALGVENAWSQRLQLAVAAGLVAPDYQPRGLHYRVGDRGFGQATQQFSQQLGSAIASASTAPGSSSGFSGGSSGGGGGGGGGGGW